MITALDTNVLLDILLPNPKFYSSSADALQQAAHSGSLVICDLVYAELCVHFETLRECGVFLTENQIRTETLTPEAVFLASRIWRKYRQQGGKRARILSDFLIGAHAQVQASRLLTRDRGFYRPMFPALQILDPVGT